MRSDIFITSYYTVYAMTICYLTVTTDLGPLAEVLFLGSSTAKLFFVSPLSVCTSQSVQWDVVASLVEGEVSS